MAVASTIASKSMRRIHPSAAAPTRSAAGAHLCTTIVLIEF